MFACLTRQKIYVNMLLLCVGVYPKCFYDGSLTIICADVILFYSSEYVVQSERHHNRLYRRLVSVARCFVSDCSEWVKSFL